VRRRGSARRNRARRKRQAKRFGNSAERFRQRIEDERRRELQLAVPRKSRIKTVGEPKVAKPRPTRKRKTDTDATV
jgi:hypothetical protein